MQQITDPENGNPVNVLIVDDESHVRTRLTDLLSDYPCAEIVGECSNGVEAVEQISKLHPELVFLDIQMPKLNGFDVLHALDPTCIPIVVFVTAFDQHAIRAFDVNAVDYVLKPIDEGRFSVAINRAVNRVFERRQHQSKNLNSIPTCAERSIRPCTRLLIKQQDKSIVLKTAAIKWVQAADKYVKLHADSGVYTFRYTMKELEMKLDKNDFVRIHRSTIVNVNAIKEVQSYFHGEFKIILDDDTPLTLSKSYRRSFNSRFHFDH